MWIIFIGQGRRKQAKNWHWRHRVYRPFWKIIFHAL